MERRFLIFRTRFASFRSSSLGVSHINSRKKPIDNHRNIEAMIDLDNKRNMHNEELQKDVRVIIFYFSCLAFGKLFFFGMRAAWSISKLLLRLYFFQVILLEWYLAECCIWHFRSCSLLVSFHCLDKNKVSK